MSVEYLQVAEEESEEPIELPLEKDGCMLLSTVTGVFPGACGMKYRAQEGAALRGVRLSEGLLHPPPDGWDLKTLYICVFPKKRKMDDSADNSAAKTKRLEKKLTCSDLICLGLPWKATEESVREYFEQFGEVVMVQLKRDASGSFKGFGFIRFGTYASQMRALAQRHNIDGRWVDVRVPNSKEGLVPQIPCKVFVGRCTEAITADDLRDYFSEFGEVTDVFVPRPFRAFGFVTFLDPEVAQSLCGEDHVIKGVSVSVSSAAPKVKPKANFRNEWPPQGPNGPSWNRGGNNSNSNSNPNFDSLNIQSLGINHNGATPTANVNLPISLVAAALNAGLLGGGGSGPQQGGPQNWPQNWQPNQPGQPGNKNWNQGWNQGGGQGNWGQGGHGKNWGGGGNWPQQQQPSGAWNQGNSSSGQWNNNNKPASA